MVEHGIGDVDGSAAILTYQGVGLVFEVVNCRRGEVPTVKTPERRGHRWLRERMWKQGLGFQISSDTM